MSNSEYTYQQAVEELQRHGILHYSAEKALGLAARKTAAWIFFGGGSCCKVRFLRLGAHGSGEAFSLEFEEISGTSSVFPSISDRAPNKTMGGK